MENRQISVIYSINEKEKAVVFLDVGLRKTIYE